MGGEISPLSRHSFDLRESRSESLNLRGLVGGAEGEAKAGGVARDGGVADGGDEVAARTELIGKSKGGLSFSAEEGLDGSAGGGVVAPGGRERGAEGVEVGAEFFPEHVALPCPRDFKGSAAGGDGGGRERGGEDETTGAVEEPVDEGARACDVTADAAEGFAEGAQDDFDAVAEASFGDEARAGGAVEGGGVGFIDEEPGAVAVFKLDEFAEGGEVAIHGEEGFGNNECLAGAFLGEDGFEAGEVVVGKDTEGGAAEAGGVDEAGVGEFVEDDGVAATDEGGDGAERGGVTAAEDKGGGFFLPGGEFLLQREDSGAGAGDESGGACAGAVFQRGLVGGGDEGGVMAEAEVIVGGEVEEGRADIDGAESAAEMGLVEGGELRGEEVVEGHAGSLERERDFRQEEGDPVGVGGAA